MRLDIQTTPSSSPNISRTTTATTSGDPNVKTKEDITSFLHKDGQADTTVHETVNPAVVNEHINSAMHNESQDIVDREVHQDHHHLSVQPVHKTETEPTTHSHQQDEVETREVAHGDDSKVQQQMAAEVGQFHDTRDVADVSHTASMGPTVAGEHIHHHVHETIQPVVEKDILQPHVVHTTHPIHEIHHNEPKHHAASNLPEVSMEEFQKQGSMLAGREERIESFEGPPTAIEKNLRAPQQENVVEPAPAGAEVMTAAEQGYGPTEQVESERYVTSTDQPVQEEYGATEPVESERYVSNINKPIQEEYATTARPTGVAAQTEPTATGPTAGGGAGLGATGAAGTAAGVAAGGKTGTSTGLSGGVPPTTEKKPGVVRRMSNIVRGEKGEGAEKPETQAGKGVQGQGRPQGAQEKKPSVIDRLNPMKDTSGAEKAEKPQKAEKAQKEETQASKKMQEQGARPQAAQEKKPSVIDRLNPMKDTSAEKTGSVADRLNPMK